MWEYRPYGAIKNLQMNRYGFRDFDFESKDKPEDTLRIAFVGDSVTLGVSVDWEENFVRRFQAAANKQISTTNIQALNFAVDGYNTLQILELIRTKALQFSPDKVVYVLCLNDFDFSRSSGDKILYFQKPTSFFLLEMEKVVQRLRREKFHEHQFRKNKQKVFSSILEMRNLLNEHGIDFQVAILPVFPTDESFENYPLTHIHAESGAFLKENSIPYIDLLNAFIEIGKQPEFFGLDIWHPNAQGHQLIAEQLLPSVLAQQMQEAQ
jgi:lysophospholipase L1-like esterase